MNLAQNIELKLPVSYISYSNVCRVCLTNQNPLIPIQEINFTHNRDSKGSVKNVTPNGVFLKYCKVLVYTDDKKPQKLCVSCMNTMCMAYNFFELFLQSNATLDRILNNVEQKKQKEFLLKATLEPGTATKTTINNLPVVLKNLLLNLNVPNTNESAPVSLIDLPELNYRKDNENQIILPEKKSCSPLTIKTENNDAIEITVEDAKVPVIQENTLTEINMQEAMFENGLQKQGRIQRSPFFINDPMGSLKDHNYAMSKEVFKKIKEKCLNRKKQPGEKPFVCLYCEKGYRDTVSRHKHVKRDHPDKMEEFMAYKSSF